MNEWGYLVRIGVSKCDWLVEMPCGHQNLIDLLFALSFYITANHCTSTQCV